ncbi:cytochrome c oxidase assembly protein COX20, mitochondrial [Galendromus occidentalis]|uniref:Cytochrome c oxidase assembly protein COX20, mitochondrial n=1 Tax=Galendromus occidentalis TaxID=34638 RepID=A0AAJ6QUX5_9ACAR|nr:cytochrome c oxidase assembly protein COX20, mitochondrial [Galendromus occidentalis]
MNVREVGEVGRAEEEYKKNVEWIPCMRTSFLTGISSGLGAGILFFLFTSRSSQSVSVGATVNLVVTLGRYFQCRWDRSQSAFEARKMKHALTTMSELRGTEEDPELERRGD